MSKRVFIAEKPSVAKEFGKALHESFANKDGYMESDKSIVTWCVGHLVTMSYPEKYDENLKKWRLDSIPFIPESFKYEVIPSVKKQFDIVKYLLTREDVSQIYVCTDSGREGEYIYRLVRQEADVKGKDERRVWIDSQTEEEIHKGIENAKPISAYDNLSDAAYLRAQEDYLIGINFSRVLSLRYSRTLASFMNKDFCTVSVGRVMTCVLGMVVNREREIRNFEKTYFYRVITSADIAGSMIDAEWKVQEKSKYYGTPFLYKTNGFVDKAKAEELIGFLSDPMPAKATVSLIERKTEKKSAPLLYNLAEIQNDCSKIFKISPDQTLNIIQELYEKKLVTYPRTDARVVSTAVCKVIDKNIKGLSSYAPCGQYAKQVLDNGWYKGLAKTKYCDDKKITDHYAIIPTGQGLNNLAGLSSTAANTYELIVRRFLSIFFPQAKYLKCSLNLMCKDELFAASFKSLDDPGYLPVTISSFGKKKNVEEIYGQDKPKDDEEEEDQLSESISAVLKKVKKGDEIELKAFNIKNGETSPPKRYTSGSIILAMENAGELIEDDDLRAQIKGSGIGTSATRAEILNKLNTKDYIFTNKKTQVITPTKFGEGIFELMRLSMPTMLNPKFTASWEKGLTMVEEGTITYDEYSQKMDDYVVRRTNSVKGTDCRSQLNILLGQLAQLYE